MKSEGWRCGKNALECEVEAGGRENGKQAGV